MKKLPLFILLQLIWITLLVGGCSRYSSSPSTSLGISDLGIPDTVTIKIMSGNTQNDQLVLEPAGTIDVHPGTVVNWIIDPSSNVKFFLIEKKVFSRNIFDSNFPPPTNYTTSGFGKVDASAAINRVFNYNIWWVKDHLDGYGHRYDPKLAIRPSKGTPVKND